MTTLTTTALSTFTPEQIAMLTPEQIAVIQGTSVPAVPAQAPAVPAQPIEGTLIEGVASEADLVKAIKESNASITTARIDRINAYLSYKDNNTSEKLLAVIMNGTEFKAVTDVKERAAMRAFIACDVLAKDDKERTLLREMLIASANNIRNLPSALVSGGFLTDSTATAMRNKKTDDGIALLSNATLPKPSFYYEPATGQIDPVKVAKPSVNDERAEYESKHSNRVAKIASVYITASKTPEKGMNEATLKPFVGLLTAKEEIRLAAWDRPALVDAKAKAVKAVNEKNTALKKGDDAKKDGEAMATLRASLKEVKALDAFDVAQDESKEAYNEAVSKSGFDDALLSDMSIGAYKTK